VRCGVCDAVFAMRYGAMFFAWNSMQCDAMRCDAMECSLHRVCFAYRGLVVLCDSMRCDAMRACDAMHWPIRFDSIRFDSIHSYCIALLASSYSIVSYCHRAVWTTDRSIHSTQLNSTQAKSSQLARCCLYVSFFLYSFVCLERRAVPHGATTLCSAMVIGWVG